MRAASQQRNNQIDRKENEIENENENENERRMRIREPFGLLGIVQEWNGGDSTRGVWTGSHDGGRVPVSQSAVIIVSPVPAIAILYSALLHIHGCLLPFLIPLTCILLCIYILSRCHSPVLVLFFLYFSFPSFCSVS
jgi:hypothetical protein